MLVYALIEVLSDKNEAVRKETINTLGRIGQIIGLENIINCMNTPL
jgi:HEAT repeat protein